MFDFIKNIFSSTPFGSKDAEDDFAFKCGFSVEIRKNLDSMAKKWEAKICKVEKNRLTLRINQEYRAEPFDENEKIYISFNHEVKTGKFIGTILNLDYKPNRIDLEISKTSEIEWALAQRRRHERVRVRLPAEIKYIKDSNTQWKSVKIANISISGIAFVSPKPYKVNSEINIKIEFPEIYLDIVGKILRTTPSDDHGCGKEYKYLSGVVFINLKQRDQDLLKAFVKYLKGKDVVQSNIRNR